MKNLFFCNPGFSRRRDMLGRILLQCSVNIQTKFHVRTQSKKEEKDSFEAIGDTPFRVVVRKKQKGLLLFNFLLSETKKTWKAAPA